MALPFSIPINSQTQTPNVTPTSLTTEEQIIAIAKKELELLGEEIPTMHKYRSYYDGEQVLVYGTQKFKDEFGTDAFGNFKDNWSGVIIDAIMDKLVLDGIIIPNTDSEESAETPTIETANSNDLPQRIWEVLSRNNIDEQQKDLYEGALVEGRAAILVWPDPELGARVDWQPGELVRVRYSDEDWRRPVLAVKRWVTASGLIRVNVYTVNFVFKFFQQALETPTPRSRRGQTIPDRTTTGEDLIPYRVSGEPWPLPNPLQEIPIVPFTNKRGSELRDAIPLQDALNYLAISSFVGSEFAAYQQRVFFTGAAEPDGGWHNSPGKVWKIPPMLDADGKPHFGEMGEFSAIQLDGYRNLIEMYLQHLAHITKTPVRLFFKSDRGGRGDAPSGESLLIEDEPLLEKVEDRQVRFGNSWWQVFRLIAKSLNLQSDPFPVGEVVWRDIRSKYRASLLEEAKVMSEIGIPLEFIISKIGLRPEEEVLLSKMIEQKAEELASQQESMQVQVQANSAEPPTE